MKLATIQAEGERTNEKPEAIAVAGISMRMEFDGLVSPISTETLWTRPGTPARGFVGKCLPLSSTHPSRSFSHYHGK